MSLSEILNILALIIGILGFAFSLMLWSNIKSKIIMLDINNLICEKTFEDFRLKEISSCYVYIKRVLDIVLSILAIVVFLPMLCIIAFAIKLQYKGTIFIKQKRIGLNGQPIYVYKFRTMKGDNESRDNISSREYNGLGLFLYRTAIDQLPMFINVILGQMSIVGTCLYTENSFNAVPEEVRQRIMLHKPGITSLWAASLDKQNFNLDTRPYFDLYYNSKSSLLTDFLITIRTIAIAFYITSEH